MSSNSTSFDAESFNSESFGSEPFGAPGVVGAGRTDGHPRSFVARIVPERVSVQLRRVTHRPLPDRQAQLAPRDEVLRLLATVEAPAQGRRFVATILDSWDCSSDLRDDLVLVVSELVSEAARYPLAVSVEIRLTRRRGRVELAVSDVCPEPPSCADERTGSGSLVRTVLDSCSEHWDWSLAAPSGRTVRAYVAC